MFASLELVGRVEQLDARCLCESVRCAAGDSAWVLPVAGGAAIFRGPGSPFNKVAGLGFAAWSEGDLERIEQGYAERGAGVQVELSTYADVRLVNALIGRGYVLTAFENVLFHELRVLPAHHDLRVRKAESNETELWGETLTRAFLERVAGEEAAAHDDFDADALRTVFRDMASKPSVSRWLVERDGEVLAAASFEAFERVAMLFGTATLPAARGKGAHAALLAARLHEARSLGCSLAMITTQPGSQSQHNAQRAGFVPVYARGVWTKRA